MPPVRYRPEIFPAKDRIDWKNLVPALGAAHGSLAHLRCVLDARPDVHFTLASMEVREASLSSSIDGSRARPADVFAWKAGDRFRDTALLLDVHEVMNYSTALAKASASIQQGETLSQHLLKAAHATLMRSPRADDQSPGEYRRSQNWLGPPGSSLKQATYIPIHPDALPDAMNAWDSYLQSEAHDDFVQLAILHAEFAALRPFFSGNGRLGRLLVPLFLWTRQFTHGPVFHISHTLVAQRQEYFERLLAISRDGDWNGWILFFLRAIITQAHLNETMVEEIRDLYDRQLERLEERTRSQHTADALAWTFRHPAFDAARYAEHCGVPKRTARLLLDVMCEAEIVTARIKSRGRRENTFANQHLIDIVDR